MEAIYPRRDLVLSAAHEAASAQSQRCDHPEDVIVAYAMAIAVITAFIEGLGANDLIITGKVTR